MKKNKLRLSVLLLKTIIVNLMSIIVNSGFLLFRLEECAKRIGNPNKMKNFRD